MSPQRSRDASLGLRSRLARARFTFIRRAFAAINPVLLMLAIVVVGTIAIAVLASGCSSGTANSSSTTTVPTTPAPTTTARPASSAPPDTSPPATATTIEPLAPTGTDEEQIRATIDTYWQEWLSALNPPDAERPGLLALVTGPQRDRDIRELQKMLALGQAGRLPAGTRFANRVLGVTITGDAAVALECVVDDGIRFEMATGRVVNDQVSTYIFSTALVRSDGAWLINDSKTQREDPGVVECALA